VPDHARVSVEDAAPGVEVRLGKRFSGDGVLLQ
jgi:hypothetical protein